MTATLNRPKIVFLDVDGTLTNTKTRVLGLKADPFVVHLVNKCIAAGYNVVLSSTYANTCTQEEAKALLLEMGISDFVWAPNEYWKCKPLANRAKKILSWFEDAQLRTNEVDFFVFDDDAHVAWEAELRDNLINCDEDNGIMLHGSSAFFSVEYQVATLGSTE